MDSICRKYGEMEGGFKHSNLKQKKLQNYDINRSTLILQCYKSFNIVEISSIWQFTR